MSPSSIQLLRQVDPPVRPTFGAPPASVGAAPLEQQNFAQLLSAVSQGQVRSGRQVDVACELHPPLAAKDMERLAAAGDMAEASGSRRALMMIDGRGLVMDVASRTIVGELSASESARMFGVDSTMYVTRDDESQYKGMLPPPGGGLLSPLLNLLGIGGGSAQTSKPH